MTRLSAGDHKISINGIHLNYHVAGDGPLLFITSPGWGIGSHYLQHGLAPLRTHFKLVCIDTRGSGKSSRPDDLKNMSSAQMADDIDALRHCLGLEKIDLMGHSNGGAITIAYAQRHPDHLRRMVLVDSKLIGFAGSETTAAILKAAADYARFRKVVPLTQQPHPTADNGYHALLMDAVSLCFHGPNKHFSAFRETMGKGSHWADLHWVDPDYSYVMSADIVHAQQAADGRRRAIQTGRLAEIRAHALIIVGRHDWICPLPVSEKLYSRIAHSELSIFEKSGHIPWIEEPERFFFEVTMFLKA
jgi:proline iminopeptidase